MHSALHWYAAERLRMPQRKRDWADMYLAAQGVKTAPFLAAALACPLAERAKDNPDTRRTSPRAASHSQLPEISEQQLLLQRRAAFDTARCIVETASGDRSADLGVDTRRERRQYAHVSTGGRVRSPQKEPSSDQDT